MPHCAVEASAVPERIGSLNTTFKLRPSLLTVALVITGRIVSYVELFVTEIGEVEDGNPTASNPAVS